MISEIINDIAIFTLENQRLSVKIAPSPGGKILSIYNKTMMKEFLWTKKNLSLSINYPGADYGSNLYGGIDELIPIDILSRKKALQVIASGTGKVTLLQLAEAATNLCLQILTVPGISCR